LESHFWVRIAVAKFQSYPLRLRLAVPHRGSDVLSNPELMNKLSIPASMREQLTKDNHQLISLIDEFAEVMPNIQIWSFYETLGSDLAGQSAESGDSLPIVSMESAAFGLGEDTPLSSDHFGVAAFRDPIKAAERTSDRPVSGRLPLPKYLQELQIVTARALWPSINVLQNVLVENHLFSRPGRDPQLPLRMQSVKRSLGRILGRDFDDFIGKPSRETGPSQPNSPGRPPSPRRPPSPKHQPRKFSIPKPAIKPKRPDVPMSYRRQSAISGQGVSFEERSHGTQKPKPKEDQALDVKEIQTQSKWEDQSEDRRDERDAPSSYLFRWIHVPCTNVAWAEVRTTLPSWRCPANLARKSLGVLPRNARRSIYAISSCAKSAGARDKTEPATNPHTRVTCTRRVSSFVSGNFLVAGDVR
jgi:hypothetical protein